MKSEQIKEITEKATTDLVAGLNAGHSEVLISAPPMQLGSVRAAWLMSGSRNCFDRAIRKSSRSTRR
jgi:hypothetical protein